VADVNANPVGATYVGGSFNLILPAGLKAAGMERAADSSPGATGRWPLPPSFQLHRSG
jgi:hypothetical protein